MKLLGCCDIILYQGSYFLQNSTYYATADSVNMQTISFRYFATL